MSLQINSSKNSVSHSEESQLFSSKPSSQNEFPILSKMPNFHKEYQTRIPTVHMKNQNLSNFSPFSEFLPNKSKPIELNEDVIKRKLLTTIGPDKEATLEAFKVYLKALINRKLAGNHEQNPNNLNSEEQLKKKLHSHMEKKSIELIANEKKDEIIIGPEDEESVLAHKNYDKILSTSKKLRDRMKTEKFDKAARFYKNKIKHFTNLDTFINAKEFFEDLNPCKEYNPNRQTALEYQSKKHLVTIKKLQKESNDFYDKRIKEFTERMTELESENVEIKGCKNHNESKSRDSKSSDESKDSGVLTSLIRNDRKNPTRLSLTKQTTLPLPIIPNLRQSNFTNNITFLEKELGMNKSVVDFFKEFYDPKGQIKKNKLKVSEVDKMRNCVMRRLLTTDNTLNRLDCQMENNEDFNQLDGFYNQTLEVLTKTKDLTKKPIPLKNDDDELDGLLRLEKLLETILKTNQNSKKAQEVDYLKKYIEYQEKSNKLLGLIDKTSRTIFQEKHKELQSKVNQHLKAYKRRSIGGPMEIGKSASLYVPSPGIYLTAVDQESIDEKNPLIRLSKKTTGHFKSPSMSMQMNYEKIEKNYDTPKILSNRNEIQTCSSEIKKPQLIFEKKWRNDIENFNQNTHFFLPVVKKRALRAISNIIERTGSIQENYGNERKHLASLENESEKFFKDVKKKINPPLESIVTTLEKPNINFKFLGLKKQALMVRKHYV